MDAGSKAPGYLTVKFAPEITRFTKTSGKVAGTFEKEKVWLPPISGWRSMGSIVPR
jgi:hypothetical protein